MSNAKVELVTLNKSYKHAARVYVSYCGEVWICRVRNGKVGSVRKGGAASPAKTKPAQVVAAALAAMA